ncbi:hypothetical protein KR074_011245, partial [Drosophila pseudoananassae]
QILQLSPEKLNNTPKAEIDVLFFNRVPKTGSMQLIELMRQLGKVHNYEVEQDPQNGGVLPILEPAEESDMIENIASFEDGSAFASHVNFLNFTKHDQPRPIYINMVRDPVERVISWYYYIRAPWVFVPGRRRNNREMPNPKWVNTEFDQCVLSGEKVCTYIENSLLEHVGDHRRQTLFFCGHNEAKCTPFNSPTAVQMAKEHVERDYAVVGSWEDTNVTLTVLERYIPRFFRGAKLMYESRFLLIQNIPKMALTLCYPLSIVHNNKITNRNKNKRKPYIEPEVKEMIRKNFTNEYDFYYFCKQRLYKQYLALNLKELEK